MKKRLMVSLAMVFASCFYNPSVSLAQPVDKPLSTKNNNESNTSVVVKFAELGKPRAMDEYWEKMARCETKSNWKDTGRYAGGLGIMTNGKYGDYHMGTWERWGGEQFAKSPDKATKEQQILVANRISTQGWYQPDGKFKEPVGFNGWGCKKHIGSPVLVTEHPYRYLFKKYKLGQRGDKVKILQTLLGDVIIDGYYGKQTQASHRKFLREDTISNLNEPLQF